MTDQLKEEDAKKVTAKEWMEKVEKSNGTMQFAPIEFTGKAKELMDIEAKVVEARNAYNLLNADLKHFNENFWYELRKVYRDNKEKFGPDSELDYEIGINTDALKDGVLIINFRPSQASPMGRPMEL